MNNLHVFNPEHDIALAYHLAHFTPPHAARQLRHDLEFLPVLWADDGDAVWVSDEQAARRSVARLKGVMAHFSGYGLRPLRRNELVSCPIFKTAAQWNVCPWGWDEALKCQLMKSGVGEACLPTTPQLDHMRRLSHRATATRVLPLLRMEGTVGEAFCCTKAEEIVPLLQTYGQLVLKAPWSSSGRGLRFLDVVTMPVERQSGWIARIIAQQECVVAEPFYRKALDFGMEFSISADGHAQFLGLSLFHTVNGAYRGNLLATEAAKRERLSRYVPLSLLDAVCNAVAQQLSRICTGRYVGPVGVDMMVVRAADGNGYLLHPCVEINLRRTMGHVALCLTPNDDERTLVMRVELDHGKYKLKIRKP